jgi:hypothetical protein
MRFPFKISHRALPALVFTRIEHRSKILISVFQQNTVITPRYNLRSFNHFGNLPLVTYRTLYIPVVVTSEY